MDKALRRRKSGIIPFAIEVKPLDSATIRVAIHGAAGRMGQRLIQLISGDTALTLAAAIDRPGHPSLGQDAAALAGVAPHGVRLSDRLDETADVAIDFSTPDASVDFCRRCAERGVALVVGTTGFEPGARGSLIDLSNRVPLLIAANFSKAVNLLAHLAELAASALRPTADIEIVERHHRFKKDAPSGTALRLAEVVARATGVGPAEYIHGREGLTGERPHGQIGLHALRTGDNPGEHTVVFGLMGECLELTHRAINRDGFARGALDAARFVAGKPPGLYSMADLLGFGN